MRSVVLVVALLAVSPAAVQVKAWQYKAPQPLIGGALATAGNVVFMGEGNGWFDAFNAKSGERVWRYNLGAGVNAPPITYQVNGEQYVAVAAGGNFQLTYPYGDTVAIFKLAPSTAAAGRKE
jgi:glucose dehydrogenase